MQRNPFAFLSFMIVSAVVLLYSVSLGHNFLFDEENIILRNPYIKSFRFLPELFTTGFFYLSGEFKAAFIQYYRPLTSLTFMLDYQIWKVNPFGYNLTNLLIHAAVCVLFLKFLLPLFKNPWHAFAGVFFYSVHTAHAELLRDVSGRGELLSGLFLVIALLFYARSRPWTALGVYALALLSKESAVLFPLYLGLYEIAFKSGKNRFKNLIPFFLLGAGYAVFRKFFCPVPLEINPEPLNTVALRVFSMGGALLDYLRALILPESFKFFGAIDFAKSWDSWQVLVTAAMAAAYIFLLAVSFKKNRNVFFGLGIFAMGLLPFMQFKHFYPEWAEHYLYVPAMGIAVLIGAGFEKASKMRDPRVLKITVAVFAVLTAFISLRTFQRNELTNDLEKFYERLSRSDSMYAVSGFHQRAVMKIREGKLDEAIALLKESLQKTRYNTDTTYQMLGACYSQKGDLPNALENLQKALEHNPDNDRYRMDTGKTLVLLGRYDEAIAIYEKAQQSIPGFYLIYRLLLEANDLAGKPEAAIAWGEKGLEATKGEKQQGAALTLAIARLAYRNGWTDIQKKYLEKALESYAGVPWQGDLAGLLSGKTDAAYFAQNVLPQYPGFEEEAKVYILMSYVLAGNCEAVKTYLGENKETFEVWKEKDLFFKQDLARAREACGLGA